MKAAALLREGRTAEAIALLLAKPRLSAGERVYLADAYFQARQWEKALVEIRTLIAQGVKVDFYMASEVKTLANAKRYAEALGALERYFEKYPPTAEMYDIAKIAHFYLGDRGAAQTFGQRAIEMKDRLACRSHHAPRPVRGGQGQRKLITYSVWGNNKAYTVGAAVNAALAAKLMPGWQVRLYVSSQLDPKVLRAYDALGAELVLADRVYPQVPAYFWRFLVINDSDTAHFLCRDADARVSVEEAALVQEWLGSGKRFHVMRDHLLHNDLILAGMWGGIGTKGVDIFTLMDEYFRGKPTNKYGHDQRFLGRMVWPRIKASVLIHDRHYSTPGTTSHTPAFGERIGAGHMNERAVLREAAALGISI